MKEVEGCSCIAFLYNQLIHCQLFCEHEKGLETFLLFPSWVLDSRSNTTVCVPVPWLVTGLEESESWCLFWLYIFLDNVALAVTMGLCYVSTIKAYIFVSLLKGLFSTHLLSFLMREVQEEEPPGMQQGCWCREQCFVLFSLLIYLMGLNSLIQR